MGKKILIIVLSIAFIGFLIRIEGVVSNSFAFTYDVGRDLLAVQKMFIEHKPPLIGQTTGLSGLYYGPWWYYFLAVPFFLTGGNPQLIAAFMVLVGAIVVVLGFYIGEKIGGTILGIIFSILLAISPYMIGLSNQIWNPNISQLLVLLLFFVVWKIVKKGKIDKNRDGIVLGLLFGLLMESELVFGLLLSFATSIFIILQIKQNIISKKLPFVGIGFFVIILPRILFEFLHNFVMTKSFFEASKSSSQFAIVTVSKIQIILFQLFQLFSDAMFKNNYVVSAAILFFLFTIWLFCNKKFSELEKKFLYYCAFVFVVFVLVLSFYNQAIYGHFYIALPALMLLVASIILSKLPKFAIALCLIFLFIYNSSAIERLNNWNKPLWEGNASVYRNQLKVIDYVYKSANKEKFNYSVYTPAVFGYTYDYLFSWYGKNKYGYIPSIKTEKYLFMILEPDYEVPGRLTQWLKIREGDGTIVKEEPIVGGIVVQKRKR